MIKRIIIFYVQGFKNMTIGKLLWIIIIIKVIILFGVIKLFFFPNYLNSKFNTEKEKSNYIIENITK